MLLGLLAATAGKIGRENYTVMKQEFGEVEELPAAQAGVQRAEVGVDGRGGAHAVRERRWRALMLLPLPA
jgi:hypothetical protein